MPAGQAAHLDRAEDGCESTNLDSLHRTVADTRFLLFKLGFEPWHYRPIELSSVAMTVFDLDRPEGIRHTANRLRDLGFTVTEHDHTAQADLECLRDCDKALRHLRRTGYVAADQLEEAMR